MVTIVPPRQTNLSTTSKKADVVLADLKAKSLEAEAERLAAQLGLSYIDLTLFPLKTNDLFWLPQADAERLSAIAFRRDNDTIYIALHQPSAPVIAELQAKAEAENASLRFFVASEHSLQYALEIYREHPFIEQLDRMRVTLSGEDLKNFDKDFGALIELSRTGDRTATTHAMETILAGAMQFDSSDIHIETSEDEARLRFRVDGELQDIGMLPMVLYRLLLSRIKLLAKMKLNVRDRAQDGHFEMTVDGKRIDIRVSVIPGQYGENINMRLLVDTDIFVSISKLGMRPKVLEEIQKQAAKPNGLILNTGPTGSGKTTTLYSLLNSINSPSLKIITVEDPIEYHLAGIVQTQVTAHQATTGMEAMNNAMNMGAVGYSFADALRAIVRQDPDVILVGEIRDGETANIALNASLTGHLVFSTLHTNDAPASIIRLQELGIDASLIGSAVNIFIAQRLVRTLCSSCKRTYVPAEKTKEAFLKILQNISPAVRDTVPTTVETLAAAVGCAQCHFTGYKGRIGVYEVFSVTTAMNALLATHPGEAAIRALAKQEGMMSLVEDGVIKCIEGITTLEEVVRHTGMEESLESFYQDILAEAPQEPTSVTK
jgi:type IV pilus assembly protein PilB